MHFVLAGESTTSLYLRAPSEPPLNQLSTLRGEAYTAFMHSLGNDQSGKHDGSCHGKAKLKRKLPLSKGGDDTRKLLEN